MPSFDTETAELVGESIARSTETLCVEESKLQYSDTEESDKQSEKASEETVSEEAPSEETVSEELPSEESSEEAPSEETVSEEAPSEELSEESVSEQSEEEEEILPPTPSSTPVLTSAVESDAAKNTALETIQTTYCHCSNCIKEYAVIAHDIFTEHPRKLRVSYCAHMMSTLHYAMSKSKEAMCATVHAFFPFVFAHVDELELHQIYDKEKQE